MKKKIILIFTVCLLLVGLAGCQNVERAFKDTASEWTGLKRVATVYDSNGNVIKQYEGRFDIEANEYGNKVKFDIDGKRVIIYNAVVIVEEE